MGARRVRSRAEIGVSVGMWAKLHLQCLLPPAGPPHAFQLNFNLQVPDGAGELPAHLRGVADDGGGALLEQLVGFLRLGFGLVAQGVQDMVRRLQQVQQQAAEAEARVRTRGGAWWQEGREGHEQQYKLVG